MIPSPSDPAGPADHNVAVFTHFLQLEEAARDAVSLEALHFSMANELRRLIEYRLAAVIAGTASGGGVRVAAVSGVAVLDHDTPMVRWLDWDSDRPVSRFEALRGRAGRGLSTDQIMKLTRGKVLRA